MRTRESLSEYSWAIESVHWTDAELVSSRDSRRECLWGAQMALP